MKTDIEKSWNFEANGYTFTVSRNKRKDYFLGVITNENNKENIEGIWPIRTLFMTLKGAKQHALYMIGLQSDSNNNTAITLAP